MKVLFIVPGGPPSNLWGQIRFKFPPLSVLTLAASTPEEVEVSVFDENLEDIGDQVKGDLVGITVMTPQAPQIFGPMNIGFRKAWERRSDNEV